MKWEKKELNERLTEVTRKFINERIDTHSFDHLFKEIYRSTGIAVKIGTNADIVWNGEHSVYITSRALQHEEAAGVFKIHFVGKEFKKYLMVVPHLDRLLKLNEIQEEEKQMSNDYKPLIEVLPDLKEGDVLDVPSNLMNITVVNTQLVWQDAAGELGTPVDFNLARLKTPVRIQPKYVGWQEAFEWYENGYTIGCEYGKETVWFHRDIVSLDESNILADKQLDGLLTTKWILK